MAGRSSANLSFSEGRFVYLCLAMVCLAISLALGWSSYANRINNNFYDLYFRQRGSAPHEASIVIVGIDDTTLARYGLPPLNRSVLARGIRTIRQAQPRLLALDVVLADVSTEEADRDLERALAGEPAAPSGTRQETSAAGSSGATSAANTPVVLATALELGAGSRWLDPLPRFAKHAAAIGHAHAEPDADGVSRRVLLEKQGERRHYWALTLECYRLLQGAREQPVTETDDFLEVPAGSGSTPAQSAVPVPAARADQRAVLINYAGGDRTFPQIGFARLLDDPALQRQLKGKVVLLGATAQGAGDRLFTPFSSGLGMAGVEIHAEILHTLLSRRYLRPVGDFAVVLAVFVITALTAWVVARFQGLVLLPLLGGIAAIVLAGPYRRFLAGEVWPAFSLLVPFGTALLVLGTYQLLVARRRFTESEAKRRRSRQQFEMATHEMRTPLAAIQGSSELLTRYALDDAKREQILRLIYEESQRLGKLVERFLSVERLSAGEMELRRRPVHLSSLLSATAERLRPAAERKGIQLLREDDRADVEIEGDPELLEFAISNLLTNAVKYSPRGTSVKVALERDGARARIHVADSGPGLSPEEVRRVFDRFYRTKDAARSETPGMGLGLAIAREIARHHGGDLVLESKPGVGSRFTISLPAPAAAPLSEPRPRGSGQ